MAIPPDNLTRQTTASQIRAKAWGFVTLIVLLANSSTLLAQMSQPGPTPSQQSQLAAPVHAIAPVNLTVDPFAFENPSPIQQVAGQSRPFEDPVIPNNPAVSGEVFLHSLTRPPVLERPLGDLMQPYQEPDETDSRLLNYPPFTIPFDAPNGFAGPSGVLPSEEQDSAHFVPVDDRWRGGYPPWDRYKRREDPNVDYPYEKGHWYNPYNQNVLKGDYPIIGQHIFMNFTAEFETIQEYRQLPVATTPFESTAHPNQENFFGDPNQYFTTNFLKFSFDLFHGNAAFKPADWQFRLTPVFNLNYLDTNELAIVNPDVRKGTTRVDDYVALQEYFFEYKLADLSPDYDFMSVRAGNQYFNSDFRGFIFSDTNRGVRLFGTRLANRDQFNLIFFDNVEKDTNSLLNTFNDRHQNVLIANYYRQDFVFPGYTAELSFHYNNDQPSFHFDENNFLARPDPVGVYQPHRVEAYYLGMAGQGHIGRINISNAFYWAVGRDSMNPIAGTAQNINAQMAALELSIDRDWVRFKGSFFYSSGDNDPNNGTAEGFDTILDNPNFAGGEFSYWQRQNLQLFGVGLVQRQSLVPDLRSSKFQGQSNFVNPGLVLFNLGMDFEITPKLRAITNANYLLFDSTEVLETYLFQDGIKNRIGTDLSLGFEYRPALNDNIVVEAGVATLLPDDGFKDLYGSYQNLADPNDRPEVGPLYQAFMKLMLVY